MTPKNIKDIYADYRNALKQLEEALTENISTNKLAIDGTIQRFEFTFELSWKLLKKVLEYNGTQVDSPRPVIKESYQKKYIKDGEGWITMLEDRNQTAHTYDQKKSLDIYNNIKNQYISLLQNLIEDITTFLPPE
jgi:nucleotidyltransferase substrate binding protein (TIGR01987 family)